jgi:hypothetical protein
VSPAASRLKAGDMISIKLSIESGRGTIPRYSSIS